MKKEITIFICEDDEVRKLIVAEFLNPEKVTYCNTLPAEKRSLVIKVIEAIEDDKEF